MLNIRTATPVWIVFSILVLGACAQHFAGSPGQAAFERGLALFNQGSYEEAAAEMAQATELEPEFGPAYLYLGRSYLNLGAFRESIPPLRAAYRLEPEETRREVVNFFLDALLGGALQAFRAGDYRDSVAYLKEGLALAPQSDEFQRELIHSLSGWGQELLSEGNFDEAQAAYREILERQPQEWGALLGMAKVLMEQGDMAAALETIRKVLEANPDSAEALSVFRELLSK